VREPGAERPNSAAVAARWSKELPEANDAAAACCSDLFGGRGGRGRMVVIRIVTTISAPVERCFDLARDIDFHVRSLANTGERAVAGRTTGLIGPGESVTWEARHLGVRQRVTAKVTEFDPPRYFRDVMTQGAFRSFTHDHRFEDRDGGTLMTDEVAFRSPLGPIGALVDRLFLAGYLRRLLEGRFRAIKREAESGGKKPPNRHKALKVKRK